MREMEPAEGGFGGSCSSAGFVDFEGVCFSYKGGDGGVAGVWALRGLDLNVQSGQFLCVLGGNGSGKSTLAKCMDAMVAPSAGRALVFGRSVADASALHFVRSNVGLVMQNPDDQMVAPIVESDVAFGPENLGVELPELAERVEQALAQVGTLELRNREVAELSGGQRQRVAIAGALAMEPAMLVLDEATSMLDPKGRADLLAACRRLHAEGMTIVMITHSMEEAALAERVAVLERGRVCMEGPSGEVLARAAELRSLGLDVPFAASLSLRLAGLGVDVGVCVRVDDLVRALEGERARRLGNAGFAGACGDVWAGVCEDGDAACGNPVGANPVGSTCTPADSAVARGGVRPCERSAAISLNDAGFRYKGASEWALRGITLKVNAGEFVGIAGRTGSGKSTLLQLIGGSLRPSEGSVELRLPDPVPDGPAQGVGGNSPANAQCQAPVGLVLQNPEHQLFAETVYDDVAFGPRNQGLPSEEVDSRVRSALSAVGLDFDALSGASPFALSGGQQRRVAIAGVLAMEPRVLVIDEPAAGLDPASRRELLSLLASLHASGITCIMASHSMDDLARMSDRVVVLDGGRVCLQGAPADVFADRSALAIVGLDVPEAQAVALRLRDAGWPLPMRLYDEESLARGIAALLEGGPYER